MSLPDTKIVTSRAQYRDMVRTIRLAIEQCVPEGAIVLVVGKGDPELVQLPGRRAWHFPRGEDGGWAGFHPADARAAIAHIEGLRALGARYFLLPATSFWWLHHYPGLSQHLEETYARVPVERSEFRLYRLDGARPAGVRSQAGIRSDVPDRALPDGVTRQLKSLIGALSEPGERVWFCAPNNETPPPVPGRSVHALPPGLLMAGNRGQDESVSLDDGLLVLIHVGASCPSEVRALRRVAEARWRRLAHREHLCSIYLLAARGDLWATADPTEMEAEA